LTRSYVYNAVDAQRLNNLLGSAITNEIENMRQGQWVVDLEAIPPAFLKKWENPQISQLLAYNSIAADGRALNPPTAVPRQPLDTAMLGAFSQIDRTIQTTFGSYDAALGINNQQLSGKAIVAGSQNSNSASMPYVTNFMAGLNHLLNVVLALLPKYYNTPRTVPVIERDGSRGYRYINPPMGQISAAQMPQFSVVAEQDFSKPINVDYDPSGLEVCVKAGVNFEIQKQEALTTLTSLMPSLPSLSQILNTDGLPIVLDNLDIRGADQLKQLADEFIDQQQQAQAQGAQQPTPEQIQMQIKMQEMQQNQQKMELEAQNNQAQNAIALGQLNLERDKLNMQRESAQSASAVQLAKAATEREVQASKFALASEDQAHQHAMDFGKMAQSRGDTHAKEESSIDESNESA
jgi:hypothetical protein